MTRGDDLSRVDVSDLLERPGRRRQLEGSVDLEGQDSSAAKATALTYDLVAEAIGAQVVLEGSITLEWTGDCRRCLEPVNGESTIQIREIFEPRPTEGETYLLDERHLDVAAMLNEAALLGLPLAPLCGGECGGPAPDRFPTTPELVEDEQTGPDPRWAALDDLTFE